MKLLEGEWAAGYTDCRGCGRSDKRHAGDGYCWMCRYHNDDEFRERQKELQRLYHMKRAKATVKPMTREQRLRYDRTYRAKLKAQGRKERTGWYIGRLVLVRLESGIAEGKILDSPLRLMGVKSGSKWSVLVEIEGKPITVLTSQLQTRGRR